MAHAVDPAAQGVFATSVSRLLRESRRRQGLTQAQVAQRTGGLVSKAALANYETGHRSLRVDVFWVIARALGEDVGALVGAAERGAGYHGDASGASPVTIDVNDLMANTDQRLLAVRRWFQLRQTTGQTRDDAGMVTLDQGAIDALAGLMNVRVSEVRRILLTTTGASKSVANQRVAAHTVTPPPRQRQPLELHPQPAGG